MLAACCALPGVAGGQTISVPHADTVSTRADVVPPLDALQLLTGRIPGVLVERADADPAVLPAVSLRGAGRPLFLMDGVVMPGGVTGLDPADIERVEVLKGAAASALYGARAGNGVINI